MGGFGSGGITARCYSSWMVQKVMKKCGVDCGKRQEGSKHARVVSHRRRVARKGGNPSKAHHRTQFTHPRRRSWFCRRVYRKYHRKCIQAWCNYNRGCYGGNTRVSLQEMLSATVVEKVIKRKKKRASENIGVLHAEFGHMLVKFDDTSSGKWKENKINSARLLTLLLWYQLRPR